MKDEFNCNELSFSTRVPTCGHAVRLLVDWPARQAASPGASCRPHPDSSRLADLTLGFLSGVPCIQDAVRS